MFQRKDPFQDSQCASAYDEGPPKFVPGYQALQKMTAVLLAESVPARAKVLVLGAGGGSELALFAQMQPGWDFVAVDSSKQMLDLAKARMAAQRTYGRVQWQEMPMSNTPAGPYDGSSCLLTLHFVADNGERLECLRHIHSCLKPGAPFMLAHLAVARSTEQTLERYAAFAQASGAQLEQIQMAQKQMLPHLHLISAEREVELLREAGFGEIEVFYQGFGWTGWACRA